MDERRELKKVLIYLYETFNGSHDLIIQEMAERKICADRKTVNEYLKEHNIKATDYYAFFENKFPAEFKNVSRPIMIINKKLDKMARRYFNYKLEDNGNKQFSGKTLKELLDELDIGYELTIREINNILIENQIKPIRLN